MKKNINSFVLDELNKIFGRKKTKEIFKQSLLVQYLVIKTKSVNKSSKSRASFANIYAIYILVRDFINITSEGKNYSDYDGLQFTKALSQIKKLPWGKKLQNHALNHRLNEEFKKYFGTKTKEVPVIRDLKTKKYWFNKNLLNIKIGKENINIAEAIIKIIDYYIKLKQKGYKEVISNCLSLKSADKEAIFEYLNKSLGKKTDARLFEIVAYSILKSYYRTKKLELYKTGRTNANDGGIDYVMKPSGRFFQVTEVFNFDKYFLDIDKLLHYPITFVIKTELTPKESMKKISDDAKNRYYKMVLKKYMD